MSTIYNVFAGQSLDRLAALSDGLFAIAMTLLVLNLGVPASQGIHNDRELWLALAMQVPRFVPYVMSFLTLGIFWVGQQTQLNRLVRSNRNLTWIHLAFLLVVSLMPFSTHLLADFIHLRLALVLYWLNILLLGVALLCSWRYAVRARLVSDDTTAEISAAMERRIVVAQALYAVGVLLCVFNTSVSIAVILLVQLNYIFAPRLRLLYRL